MCNGGRFVADFAVGTTERPDVPPQLEASLTTATDMRWVVWAYKLAVPAGEFFRPLTDRPPYPADAIAQCGHGERHHPPDPGCTCGFHAVSKEWRSPRPAGTVQLEVALTGRVLAFEWPRGGLLFRAERQTVARIGRTRTPRATWVDPPADPDGRLARVQGGVPAGSGPMRLDLPTATPPAVRVHDDVGLCVLTPFLPRRGEPLLVPS